MHYMYYVGDAHLQPAGRLFYYRRTQDFVIRKYTIDPEIDRVGLNDRSEFNSGQLDRSTRLLTGLTIDSTSLNFDRLNRLTRLQLVPAILKQRCSDAR
jgi:hypothetical protein